jgi:hypothetical protein
MTVQTAAPEEHSRLVGGSTAKRRLNCPGSYRLEATLPDGPSSQYADEGTALHKIMSEIVLNGWTVDDLKAKVAGRMVDGFMMNTERMNDCIIPCTRFLDQIDADFADEGGLQMLVENRVEVPGIPGAFGTADIIGRTPRRSIILDWKFGGGVFVDATENAQAMFYARGGMHSFPAMFEKDPDWPVTIYIAQPRFGERGFQRWDTTVRELEAFRMQLVAAIAEAIGDNPRYKLGDWCEFAKCQATCPLRRKAMVEIADIQLSEVPRIAKMAAADQASLYADMLDFFEIVEPVMRQIRADAHEFIESGRGKVPGWATVAKRAVRSWSDETLAMKALVKAGLPKKELMTEPEFKSPAQVEKVAKAHGVNLPDEIGPKNNRMKLIQSISSGTTLGRDDGSRAVVPPRTEQLAALAKKLGAK